MMQTLVLLVACFASGTAYAATFHVTSAGAHSDTPARGTLTLRPMHDVTSAPLVTAVSVPGSISVEVKEGTYVAELQVRGFWLAPQVVMVRPDSVIELVARPTGSVMGGGRWGSISRAR